MRQLAQVYARISSELATRSALKPTNSQQASRNATSDDASSALIWALIYGARTFQIAHRLLTTYPPKSGSFYELGAGLGPFALRAALCPEISPVSIVDLYPPSSRIIAKIYSMLQIPPPHSTKANIAAYEPHQASNIAIPFAFREIGSKASSIERWLHSLSPQGRLYIVEPGTQPIARELQAARDTLRQQTRILGPCQHTSTCPRLVKQNDWCHFTWRIPLGTVGRRIADIGRRRGHEIHASWLILERSAAAQTGGPATNRRCVVLSVRPGSKECDVRLCGNEQEIRVLGARRQREIYEFLSSLEPGDIVELNEEGTRVHGGGTVLERSDGLVVVARMQTR